LESTRVYVVKVLVLFKAQIEDMLGQILPKLTEVLSVKSKKYTLVVKMVLLKDAIFLIVYPTVLWRRVDPGAVVYPGRSEAL